MYVLAQNVTDTQIVIDADGRTLGGGEWGAVDRHDPTAQAAIGDSRIAIHPDVTDGPDLNDDARAALELAGTLEARRLELANMTSDRLEKLAAAAGIDVAAPGLLPDQMDPMRRRLARRTDLSLTDTPLAEPALAGEASTVDEADATEGEPDDRPPPRKATARGGPK